MKTETIDFLKKIMGFNEMVGTLIDVLDSQAQKIEDAKLKAVGARNKIEGEEDINHPKNILFTSVESFGFTSFISTRILLSGF